MSMLALVLYWCLHHVYILIIFGSILQQYLVGYDEYGSVESIVGFLCMYIINGFMDY